MKASTIPIIPVITKYETWNLLHNPSFTLNFLHLKTRPINSPIIPELATQPHQIPHPAIISVNIWPINPMENPTRGPNKAENIASRAMAGFS